MTREFALEHPDKAFEKLAPSLHIYRYFDPTGAMTSEDFKQVCMIEIWKAAKKFKEGRMSFDLYLFVRAHGRLVDLVRGFKKYKFKSFVNKNNDEDDKDISLDTFAIVDEELSEEVLEQIIIDWQSKAEEQKLKIFNLAKSGLTQVYIASYLGISQGLVSLRLREIKEELVSSLNNFGLNYVQH